MVSNGRPRGNHHFQLCLSQADAFPPDAMVRDVCCAVVYQGLTFLLGRWCVRISANLCLSTMHARPVAFDPATCSPLEKRLPLNPFESSVGVM